MHLERTRPFCAALVAVVTMAIVRPPAKAQDAAASSPFDTPPVDQPAVAVGDASQADAAAGTAEATPAIDPSQYGPAIQAIFELERTTPEELLEGVLLLIEFDEEALAKPWLDQLIAAAPDAQVQAELARRFGSHRLMQLASAQPLGEPARELAMSYLDASAAQVRDPERLSRLIEQLADPSIDVQYAAISGLVEAGEAAAVALVAALDEAASDQHREAMQVALAELVPLSIGPLLAGLSADGDDSPHVAAASARVLSRSAPAHLAVWLLEPSQEVDPSSAHVRENASQGLERMIGRVPTPEWAERMLQESITRHLEQTIPLDIDENEQVDVWYWHAATESPAMAKLDLTDAHLYYASKLADDLLSLRPDILEYRIQATMLRLASPELESQQGNMQLPQDAAVARQILLGAMERAIKLDLPRAIAAAARELRELPPDERILLSHAPGESPLVAALMHSSRGVRWEALATIMEIDPANPYPGASRVMQTLAEFIQAGGRPRAVVAVPVLEKAQTIAAAVDAHGYDVALATTGREAILASAARGGAEFVLLDARISQPVLREVLYQLRVHPASSGARVAIIGTGRGLEQGRSVANDHETTLAIPYPQDEDDVDAIIERLRSSTDNGATVAGLPEQDAMSRQALAWLGAIAARNETFYDVRKFEPVVLQATSHVEQSAEGAGILANFPSHESQLRLVNLASNLALSIVVRNEAAEAFRTSVERHGVQLTSSEILAQYDRYNASESADRATQNVLAHVLDSIEAGRNRTVGP